MSGRYWLCTIPYHDFTPYLPQGIQWIKGQLELSNNTQYLHWQFVLSTPKTQRLSAIKTIFGSTIHAELSRSIAAEDYVHKEDTAVIGTRFELGQKLFKRNSNKDWDLIWEHCKHGRIDEIPAQIRVQNYRTIKQIEKDYLAPVAAEKTVVCYWGSTGTGKSRRAWDEATFEAYPKDPNTKFWDGYRGQENVVIDEFRGKIDISHMLRWLDRYPVNVECKFGATTFNARRLWITSNMDPRDWYTDLDQQTKDALIRRMTVIYFPPLFATI